MKNLKMSVLTVGALALMAFVGAGSASATELTCGAAMCEAETTIESESEGKAVLDAPFGNVECNSTVKGHTENTGSSTETVHGPITTLTFTNCGSNTVKVLKSGTLEIHTQTEAANNNGTLTSNGAEVEVVHLGVQCIFTTSSTDIGTLTGSATTGGNATLDISAKIPRTGGSGGAFCGESAPWTGSYKVTAPSTLNVDGSSAVVALPEGGGEGPLTYTVGLRKKIAWHNLTDSELIINGGDVNHNGGVGGILNTVGGLCTKIASTGTCENIEVECVRPGLATVTLGNPRVGTAMIRCD